LQERKEGQPYSNPKDKQKRRKQKSTQNIIQKLLNSPARALGVVLEI